MSNKDNIDFLRRIVESPIDTRKTSDIGRLYYQLDVFQSHLREVESIIQFLLKYSPTEVDSYRLIEKLIKARIQQLNEQIATLSSTQR